MALNLQALKQCGQGNAVNRGIDIHIHIQIKMLCYSQKFSRKDRRIDLIDANHNKNAVVRDWALC